MSISSNTLTRAALVIASGLALFGSGETVARKVTELSRMDIPHIALLMDFGLMPEERVLRSMRGFASGTPLRGPFLS